MVQPDAGRRQSAIPRSLLTGPYERKPAVRFAPRSRVEGPDRARVPGASRRPERRAVRAVGGTGRACSAPPGRGAYRAARWTSAVRQPNESKSKTCFRFFDRGLSRFALTLYKL